MGSQKGGFGECTLVPVFVPGEHANVPSFRLSLWGNIRTYPRSGFRSGSFWGNIRQSHPFGNHPFRFQGVFPVLKMGFKRWFFEANLISSISEFT